MRRYKNGIVREIKYGKRGIAMGIKKALRAIWAVPLICALLLSSCGNDTAVTETTAAITQTPSAAETTSGTEAATETVSVTSSETETQTESETTEAAAKTETEASTTTATATEAVSSETTDKSVTTTAAPSETATTTTTTAAATTTTVTTTTSAPITTAPKAEVIIPKVKTPLADGTNVISGENGEVDYGNASEGYISAVYTGSSKAVKLRIKQGGTQYDHNLDPGGKREFFPLMGSGSYTVKMYEQVSGKNYAEILSGDFDAAVKSDTSTYLYPNKYVSYKDGSECVKKAAEVCAGKSGDAEKIGAVFLWISDNITYDKNLAATVQSGYVPDPDSTLAAGKGICFDYASLFAAMCRSQSIPARLVIGYAEPDIYHAWNEVYTEETGWITPELFLKKKGYNIADATFYAGNSDKEKIAGYISDEGNYSAMYRY